MSSNYRVQIGLLVKHGLEFSMTLNIKMIKTRFDPHNKELHPQLDFDLEASL